MKHGLAGLDRVVSAVVGLTLIVGGLLVIGWWAQIDAVRDLFGHADQGWYATAPEQGWWAWALAAAMIGGLALGGWLLMENVRPNRAGELELETGVAVGEATVETGQLAEATATAGSATLSSGQLAGAAAEVLARQPEVASASGTALFDRGRRTLRITVTAEPDVPLEHLRRLAESTCRDIDRAIEDADLAVRFDVHYLPVRDAG